MFRYLSIKLCTLRGNLKTACYQYHVSPVGLIPVNTIVINILVIKFNNITCITIDADKRNQMMAMIINATNRSIICMHFMFYTPSNGSGSRNPQSESIQHHACGA